MTAERTKKMTAREAGCTCASCTRKPRILPGQVTRNA